MAQAICVAELAIVLPDDNMFSRLILLTIAVSAAALPAVAQVPTPTTTAFDGTYVGTATSTGGGRAPHYCGNDHISVAMRITEGQVVIHEVILNNGFGLIYRGSVNAAGDILAFRYQERFSTYIMFS
jgi:hypothetical protein